MPVNWSGGLGNIKFATWVANGQLLGSMPKARAPDGQWAGKAGGGKEKRRLGWSRAALQLEGQGTLPLSA
jgi:hypothetical protein